MDKTYKFEAKPISEAEKKSVLSSSINSEITYVRERQIDRYNEVLNLYEKGGCQNVDSVREFLSLLHYMIMNPGNLTREQRSMYKALSKMIDNSETENEN